MIAKCQILTIQDIENLNKDSDIIYLKALYQCENIVYFDENDDLFYKNKVREFYNYKSSFYLSFIANKDSLSNKYLEARKALYKTYQQIKQEQAEELQRNQQELEQELQGLDSKQRESKLQEIQREQIKKQKEKERQERFSSRNTTKNLKSTSNNAYNTKDSNLILESKDKNNVIIFLDSANSLSNLIHIHNDKIDIFTKDNTRLDIQELESLITNYKQRYTESNNIESSNQESHIDCNQESKLTLDSLHSANIQIFLYSQLLLGSSESPSNPLFFGELDSKSEFRESKPIYHLIGEIDSNSIESTNNNRESNNSLSTLQVFLGSNTLTLLNYSLLDSSLNIKLEYNSKESKAILEREQTQREQKDQDSKTQDSIQSTALLHPILEDTEIKCPHNGVVKLKSNKGKPFTSKGIPLVLESDLLNASIIGCTNNIAGVPTPCTSVAVILPSARGLKKFNDDYPIMQDLVSSGVMSDKGFPLVCTPKENTFRINSPNPTQANNQTKESLLSHIQLTKPILRLHYKIHSHQKDNLPIYRIKIQDSIIESNNDAPLDSLSIDIAKDTKILDDTQSLDSNLQDILSSIYTSLKDTYAKDYKYHYLSLQLDSNALILILLIPQSIPKVYKELYKDYTYKDYGIGKYHYLYNYCTYTMLEITDYTQIGLDSNPSNATILTLHTPYKAQRLELQLANGLDSLIESRDREQNLDSLLTLKLINGGYKEKYWSFGEGVEEKEIEEKIDISQGILIASNDDAIAYQALEEMSKKEKWRQLKTSYLAIHNITQTDIKMSRQRIGEKRLWDWIHSEDNYLEYGENEFIKAEIRYHKIGGPIYDVFLKTPHQYINTCAARISKALTDFGIVIKKLQGMKSNAYVANAGTNTKPYKILVRVEDMIDFLKLNDSLGEPIVFRPKANQTSDAFCKEVLSSLNANGIIAMIIAFRDAGGHVTLWDNDKGEFLDNVDNSDGVNYMNGRYNIREVYFWEIAR